MTGTIAKRLKPKLCVLNHLNVHDAPIMMDKVNRVSKVCSKEVDFVLPAYDFLEIIIPQGGFDFSKLK